MSNKYLEKLAGLPVAQVAASKVAKGVSDKVIKSLNKGHALPRITTMLGNTESRLHKGVTGASGKAAIRAALSKTKAMSPEIQKRLT